jgi:dienelactone hydrolase
MSIVFQRSGASVVRAILVGWALAASAISTFAQTTIEFNSLSRKQGFPAIFQGRAEYTDKVSGVLTRPDGATGNIPAMVIMHSSGGINDTTLDWSKYFLKMGVSTFVVDSFKPRGIEYTTLDQSLLSYPASTADALNALKAVAAQPGVDPKRIGVIGFSRGAMATAASSIERVRSGVLGKESDLKFALHIAYYGGCNVIGTATGAPTAIFIGTDDDFTSAASCATAVPKFRAKGANIVDFTVYRGVMHSFDVMRNKTLYIAKGQGFRNCNAGQDLDNLTYYVGDTQVSPKEYGDHFGKCIVLGTSVAYNYAATSDSQNKVKALVTKTFGL